MASEIKQDASSCLNDPNFAVICAFLQKFGTKLNIVYPNFHDLQQMIENTDEGRHFFFYLCIDVYANSKSNLLVIVFILIKIHRFFNVIQTNYSSLLKTIC